MIVDTSAVIAILRREANHREYLLALREAACRRISAATLLETALVVDGVRNVSLSRELDDFVRQWQLIIEPVTEQQARFGREAFREFGKGSGHPAQLNFGDCFAYALAKDKAEPLLFKGDDFRHTDMRPALTRT